MDATTLLSGHRIVPVVVLDSAAVAVPVAKALLAGGIRVAEVTLRTDDAIDGICAIASDVPDMLIGAGSVRSVEQMRQVKAAGAQFVVSPGHTLDLISVATEFEMPFVPGACTPAEMMGLLERGYTLQKFFPAEQAGGATFLKSVGGPLPEIKFMPTGGVTTTNAGDYLKLANVSAVGGSWIAPLDLQRQGDFLAIAKLAADSLQLSV